MIELNNILDDFDQAWRNGEVPQIDEFISQAQVLESDTNELLRELAAIDLEYRWRNSIHHDTVSKFDTDPKSRTISSDLPFCPVVEDYVRKWPVQFAEFQDCLTLIIEEFRARHRWGSPPSIESYIERFGHSELLTHQLKLVRAEVISDEDSEAEDDPPQFASGGTMIDFDPHPPASMNFGRYKLVRILGAGGMGDVWLAIDPQLDRKVALKRPRLNQKNEEGLARFVNEAKAAANLRHPGICPVYDAGEIDGQPFLTMAYIEGNTLQELWRQNQLQSVSDVVLMLSQVASAMQAAHTAGVVHRDLKPSNIMIDVNGEPVIMDFGLAFRQSDDSEGRITKSGETFGSPSYMSPEQVEGSVQNAGALTDIYTLGVILFEGCTGELPFKGSVSSLMAQIARDTPPDPSTIKPDIDSKLERLCVQMLSKDPSQRPKSMEEVAERLREIHRRLTGGMMGATAELIRIETEPQFSARTPRKKKAGSRQTQRSGMALAAILLGLMVLGVFIYIRGAEGTIVIDVAPGFEDQLSVTVLRNGDPAIDGWQITAGENTRKIRTGRVEILLPDGLEDEYLIEPLTDELTVRRGGKVAYRISRKPETIVGSRELNWPTEESYNFDFGAESFDAKTHRRIAEWVIRKGGYLNASTFSGGLAGHVDDVKDLPQVDFRVVGAQFYGCDLTPEDLKNFVPIKGLQHLLIAQSTLTVEHLRVIGQFKSLQGLSINVGERVEISDAEISTLVRDLPNLRSLDLQDIPVTGSFLTGYPQRPQLTKVVLRAEELKPFLPELDATIGNSLSRTNPFLTLELNGYSLSPKLIAGLKQIRGLNNLSVKDTTGLSGQLSSLSSLPALQTIDASNAALSDADIDDLKQFKSLQRLILTENAFTKAGMKSLQDALPDCEISSDYPDLNESSLQWSELFNGKDLTGWQPMLTYGGSYDIHRPASDGWEVRDGTLVCTTAEHGFLQHEGTFGDFDLSFEFKLADNSNSGLHFRTRMRGSIVNESLEAQIIDDDYRSPQDPGFKVSSTTRTGAIYAVTGPNSSALRPLGEWNEMRIRCEGDHIEIFVNGTQTASVDTSTKSALKDRPKTGKILISNWAGEAKGVAFRNIRLRKIEVPDVEPAPEPSQPERPRENLALYFDGVDDHVVTPINFDGSHPITIEAWVAAAHPWESGRIIYNVSGYGRGIDILRAEGWMSPKWFASVMKTGPSAPLATHYQPPKENPKVHLAYVWDGQQSRFYINGDASGQTQILSLGEIPSSNEQFLIGTGYWKNRIAPEEFFRFHGYADEVRFSKVARYTANFKPVDRHEPDSDTIALYHCDDETAGLILRDSSGNKNDAEITGATRKPSYEMHSPGPYYKNVDAYERSIIKDQPERTGPALRFVTNDAVVNVPPVFIDFTEPFTVEYWGTPESEWPLHDQWARVGVAFGKAHVVLSASDDRWLFNFWDQDSIQADIKRKHTPRMNHRTHVAAQWSGEHLELFINGQPVPGPETGIGGFPSLKTRLLEMLTHANERKLTIGSWGKKGQFGGEIDSFRLSIGNRYQQADTPEEVPVSFEPQELKADEQTVILYDFHEGEGAVLHDLSGNGYHGDITPEAIWVPAPPKVEPLPGLIAEPQSEDGVLRSQLITRWPRAEPCHHTFSPDGKLYALGSMDGYVRIFEGGPEGKLKSVVHIREKQKRQPFGMHWAADSKMFFTATNDWIQIWSTEGKLLHEWVHKLSDIEWHPSENILGGADRSRAYLWTPAGEELLSVQTWGDDRGSRFVWSPGGNQFLTVNGKVVMLWTRNGEMVKQIPVDFTVQDCEWSPDGELIVFMTDDRQFVIMSAAGDLLERGQIPKHWGELELCWAPNSQTFAVADSEFISIWDRNGNAVTRYQSTQFKSSWNCFSFSPDGQQHLILKIDKGLAIHDATTGKSLKYLQEDVPRLTALAWNRNLELLTTSLMCSAAPVAVVNQQGVSQVDAPKIRMYPYDIAWNPGTDDIIVAGNWDLRRFEFEGNEKPNIEKSEQLIRGDHLYQKIAVHPLGDLHASVGNDNQVRIVNSKGEVVSSLPMGKPVHEISFSPDGKWLAVNTAGEAVTIFDSNSWEKRQTIKAGSMFGIAWSSDSTRIATMIAYGPVKIFDLNGKVEQEFEPDWRIGRNHSFTAIAFSPDDQWVVTSRDIDIQAYNIKTKERRQFPLHVDLIVDAVWISPTEFVVASRDGTLSCYDVASGKRRWITLFVLNNQSELKSATISNSGEPIHIEKGIEPFLFRLRERIHGLYEIEPFISP